MKAFRSLFITSIFSLSLVAGCGGDSDLEPGGVDLYSAFDEFVDSNTSLTSVGEPRQVYGMTDTTKGFLRIKMNRDGSKIAYGANDDPVGGNPSGVTHIFFIDVGAIDVDVGDGQPVQISQETPDGNFASARFDMDSAGDQIVFVSRQDLTGDNSTFTSQVFLAATDGSSVTQVTMGASIEAQVPAISGDGQTIVFLSTEDLTGGNAAGDRQVYTINADGTGLRQVTTTVSFPETLVIANNGIRIAYEDRGDPFASNADGSYEIFAINIDGTGHIQLTDTLGDSRSPKISDDGTKIVFSSDGEFTPGSNADGESEVYIIQDDGTGLVRITDSASPSGELDEVLTGQYDISGDGEIVVFTSRGDLLGLNGGTFQTVYWAFTNGTVLTQQMRPGETVPEKDGFSQIFAFTPATTIDGQLFAYESGAEYDTDAVQTDGEKLYLHLRQ